MLFRPYAKVLFAVVANPLLELYIELPSVAPVEPTGLNVVDG